MKKYIVAAGILVVIAAFGFADYYFNLPGGIPKPDFSLQEKTNENDVRAPEVLSDPNVIRQIIEQGGLTGSYTIEKRTRSTELFEFFDLSDLANVSIYMNILIEEGMQGRLPIYAYEIHGPKGQGSITYLNVKLAMIAKLGSEVGINETGDLGYNNLYYNDDRNPTTAFLITQVGDVVFGFRYSRASTEAFDFIRSLVNNYMSQISINS